MVVVAEGVGSVASVAAAVVASDVDVDAVMSVRAAPDAGEVKG